MREVGRHTREYLNAGFSGDRLLSEMGQSILKDDNGWNLVHALRVVFDEWKFCDGHPARNQLLIGLCPLGHRCAQAHRQSIRRADRTTVRTGPDGGGSVRVVNAGLHLQARGFDRIRRKEAE